MKECRDLGFLISQSLTDIALVDIDGIDGRIVQSGRRVAGAGTGGATARRAGIIGGLAVVVGALLTFQFHGQTAFW